MKKEIFNSTQPDSAGFTSRAKNYLTIYRFGLFALLFFASILSVSAQQHPSVSVGHQQLSITYEDCLARAKQALESEGYAAARGGGNFYWGGKGIHHASIVCDGTPDNRMDVHVFVASTSSDGNVPGAERVRLQQRMERSTTQGTGGGGGELIEWNKQADGWRGQNGKRIALQCRPGGTISSRVWGTDVYTDDSSICSAAVHAGLINTTSGGSVIIEIRPGANSYAPSTRNGVTSKDYGAWHGSFIFIVYHAS